MMIDPPINELVKKTGSRYQLVIETAKRARQLVDGAPPLADAESDKEVSIAIEEIYENKLNYLERQDLEKIGETESLFADGLDDVNFTEQESPAQEPVQDAAEETEEALDEQTEESGEGAEE